MRPRNSPNPLPLRFAVLLLALAGLGGRCSGSPDPAGPYQLVWEDAFDGPAGQPPNPANWGFDVGTGVNGWGNLQLEYDTARPENVSLDGQGHLAITARRENYPPGSTTGYTSARILTKGRFERNGGRVEARIKLPSGQGVWPAFWMLGANIDSAPWPGCGEIDIMENRGQDMHRVLGTAHGPGYSGAGGISSSYELPGGATFDADFHVFAVEWDSGQIVWKVDEVAYQTLTQSSLPPGAPWVFDRPFFVILNVAVGGTFVGSPGGAAFPQTMLVDHVRYYER